MTTSITTGISLYLNTNRDDEKNPTDNQMWHYLRMNPEKASGEVNFLLQIAWPGDHLLFLHTATAQAERYAHLFLTYEWFFRWLVVEPRTQREVDKQLREIAEKDAILSFLTVPDTQNKVFFSLLGEALRKRFRPESEETALVDRPDAGEEQDIDAKISSAILHSRYHDTAHILAAYRKIAQIPRVEAIIGGRFENTTFTRSKRVSDDGLIRMLGSLVTCPEYAKSGTDTQGCEQDQTHSGDQIMNKKNALLVIAGGRVAPDVLSLLYLQPQLVVAITSEEGWQAKQAFCDIAQSLPGCTVERVVPINAYNLEIGTTACRNILSSYSDTEWNWTITIGSSPKITGIAAYEVAKERKIPCWYIDTRHEKVVSLVKDVPVESHRFFHLSLAEYMRIQRRECQEKKGPTNAYRRQAEGWVEVAATMAATEDITDFTSIFYKHYKQRKNKEEEEILREQPLAIPATRQTHPLLQTLLEHGLLYREQRPSGETLFFFTSLESAHFLGTGDWLEIYVWHKATEATFADDCQWGCEIKGQVANELDLALIYKAQLIIAECKTAANPFKGDKGYLRDLDAAAHLLGGAYVSKVLITNQPGTGDSYRSLETQAKERHIVIVTREKLADIGAILKNEAINPIYERH
jgi:hypothetical protein